ncbi:MAG: lipid A biosynthesis acyltransferase [Gammaproteobacteria bacterium]|nr:lipid A biosynthesis acyltransferase [Gammaproteobacteria bacterium]
MVYSKLIPNWKEYLEAKYWPTWIGLGILRLIALLPYQLQFWLGFFLGEIMYHLISKRRHIVEVNIDICFPELSEQERAKIVRDHFHYLGLAVCETAIAWWASERKIRSLVTFKGLQHIEKALSDGKGAIIMGAHYTTMEISGCFITLDRKFAVSYRPFNNQLMNEITYNARKRIFDRIFERTEIRQTYRYIKGNHLMWIAADQDMGHKQHSVYAPFFGHAAATQTVPSRMAKVTEAPVIPYQSRCLPNAKGYEFEFFPPLENFPGQSLEEDAALTNKVLEDIIRISPEQYLWVHRRFKTQPDGKNLYQ